MAVLFVLLALLPPQVSAQEVPELQITSTNYIAIDAETGEIFAQRGAHERRAPASITKMFTAIEAIESATADVAITTSESDLVSEFASQVGFSPGESFTVEELLYGMMLPSGNDAARALARGLGAQPGDTDEESLDRFLNRLNTRIKNMGLTDTQLVNPDGWGVPDHYSSAYDLAAFMMYALRYPRFVQAFSTGIFTTDDGQYEFRNNNRMLRTYEGIIGGKTGYDDDAGWCLINVAERDGRRVIAVTLNGIYPDDWYDDNRVLLDYALDQQALRAESGAEISGEVITYRDPDAAIILAMGSAGATIGEPVETSASNLSELVAPSAEPELLPLSEATSGASESGLAVAAAVAVALTAMHGLATWRLRSPGAHGATPVRLASSVLSPVSAPIPESPVASD
ncbi:MAG: D-alanyl-D-alanine carboxypeptidase family protein [Thermomicrobiales bacterium]